MYIYFIFYFRFSLLNNKLLSLNDGNFWGFFKFVNYVFLEWIDYCF